MRYLTTAMMSTVALLSVNCNDGGVGIPPAKSGGASGTATGGASASGGAGVGTGGAVASGGNVGSGGATGAESGGAPGTGTGGAGTAGTGTSTGGRAASGGATGSGGAGTGTGGAGTGTGGAAAGGSTGTLKTGPFKILVMSTTLEFGHDSIPTCFTMLQDLGKATAPERAMIAGLGADTTWTVDQMGTTPSAANYFSEVSAANLANYEMFYSNNPTGPVFTNAPQGAQKKTIFQEWWTNGGAWAGQHSATDFEKSNGGSWAWWHDNIDGGYFVDHDADRTPGTVNWQPDFVNHPILKGLTSPWSTSDEWYLMNRNIEAVAGFKVLAKVTVTNSSKGTSPRPAIWTNENPKGGRAFYTIKGHNKANYTEAQFRQIMLRGILWAVHRLPGGN